MRTGVRFAIVIALSLAPASLHATSATVPSDYPTLPAAIASGVDTVFVKDGTYPDSIQIARGLVLLPAPSAVLPPALHLLAYPTVGSITIVPGDFAVVVRDLHVNGYVRQTSPISVSKATTFEACRIDSGMIVGGNANFGGLSLRGCLVFGELFAWIYYPDISGCTIVGSLVVQAHGIGLVRGNFVTGPGSAGISVCCQDGQPAVIDNRVVGATNGIVAEEPTYVATNTIEDCSQAGILMRGTAAGQFSINNNVVRRSGTNGIEGAPGARGIADIGGNQIEDAKADGITPGAINALIEDNVVLRSGPRGIEATSGWPVIENRVLDSGAEGIAVTRSACQSNVIGRSGGTGLLTTDEATPISQNTSYLNGGDGFRLAGSGADTASKNVAYKNGGVGLAWVGTGSPHLECNDWFGNTGGATSGISPGATDLALDPLFCNPAIDDVSLSHVSALLDAPGCGLIGALGEGCGYPAAVGDGRPSAILGLEVSPTPAGGTVRFAWSRLSQTAELQIYDVTGQRRWSRSITPGVAEVRWDGRGADGAALAPGIYFAKITVGGKALTQRVVLIR